VRVKIAWKLKLKLLIVRDAGRQRQEIKYSKALWKVASSARAETAVS